jgi:hypothetical protein
VEEGDAMNELSGIAKSDSDRVGAVSPELVAPPMTYDCFENSDAIARKGQP